MPPAKRKSAAKKSSSGTSKRSAPDAGAVGPKFGSPEWREKYSKGKKKPARRTSRKTK